MVLQGCFLSEGGGRAMEMDWLHFGGRADGKFVYQNIKRFSASR